MYAFLVDELLMDQVNHSYSPRNIHKDGRGAVIYRIARHFLCLQSACHLFVCKNNDGFEWLKDKCKCWKITEEELEKKYGDWVRKLYLTEWSDKDVEECRKKMKICDKEEAD